jgi:tRNA A37 threonylcarbamoyladenosine modification protein TsaB
MQPFVPNPYQGEFQVIFDAKAGGLYVLQGRKKQGQVCLDKPKFMSLEDFVKNTSENGLIVSPHAQLLRSRIGLDIKTADYSHQYIISFINEKYQKGQYISPLAFNAVYLRNP